MPTDKPLILVTNDDGILAEGISCLAQALADVGDVVVCAPARQQSAVSHGITLNEPLRVRTMGRAGHYAVTGTPADAVFIGLSEVCPRPPSLVVSGINHGTNLGTDVLYSGTVAGAMEAALRGIMAIAVSQQLPIAEPSDQTHNDRLASEDRRHEAGQGPQRAGFRWDPLEHRSEHFAELLVQAACFTAELARVVLAHPLAPGVVLNVNAPDCKSVRYAWTRLGHRMYRTGVERRIDPRGVPYYWIGNSILDSDDHPGSDAHVLAAGIFSVTPIRLDWNAEEVQLAAKTPLAGFQAATTATAALKVD